MSTYEHYLRQVLRSVAEVSVSELLAARASATPLLLLDVREPDEHEQGVIPGARLVPRGLLEGRIEQLAKDPEARIVVYCHSGKRSAFAAHSLSLMGYGNVSSLSGGIVAWRAAGGSVTKPELLSASQRARYSRHVLLPEVGEAGQLQLLKSRVLLLGAGGLGCPAAYYLAAAGVGTLGIIDDDNVDESNLQRQILHNSRRIGQKKVASAEQTLRELNPDVKVIAHPVRLGADNALDLLSGYDVIVDGADNFPTRYLLNDASVILNIPVVHASVYRFEAQLTTFFPTKGPCYRCLYPEPPPPELAPSCEQAGVLGVLPGVLGVLQATETLKLLLNVGESLVGRLLLYDALLATFNYIKVRSKPDCPACGLHATPPVLTDWPAICKQTSPR